MAITKDTIINDIKTTMETILVANGYHTDVGQKVWEGRDTVFKENEVPALNIKEIEDTTQDVEMQGAYNVFEQIMQIEIEMVTNGASTTSEIREIEADVDKAIGTNQTWSGNAIKTDSVTTVVNYADQNENKVIGKTRIINVHYRKTAWEEN